MKQITMALFAVVIQGTSYARQAVVSDELVQNLQCNRLSAEEIYKAIRPDAFSPARQLMIKNYEGKFWQGHCWAISRTERLNLLLSRKTGAATRNPFRIFAMMTGIDLGDGDINSRVFEDLETFQWASTAAKSIQSFRRALSIAQTRLFTRDENKRLLVAQSQEELKGNIDQIVKLAQAKKLPLVNIRYKPENQHVMVAIGARTVSDIRTEIDLINSNAPGGKRFIAVDYTDNGTVVTYRNEKVDLYIVDEESERHFLNNALMKHYQGLCNR